MLRFAEEIMLLLRQPRIELIRKMDLIGREVMAAILDIWRIGRTLRSGPLPRSD